jgi:hypothetical protein
VLELTSIDLVLNHASYYNNLDKRELSDVFIRLFCVDCLGYQN